jgi:DNA-binding Lrp family transcriptional regulator
LRGVARSRHGILHAISMRPTPDDSAKQVLSARRTEVAVLCDEEPRTVGELARAMDMKPGAVRPTVYRMSEDGILRAAGHRPDAGQRRGGKLWILDPTWRGAVTAAQARLKPRAPLPGTEVILVPLTGVSAAARALLQLREDSAISWSATLRDSTFGLMIAAAPAKEDDVDRLLRDVAAVSSPVIRVACGTAYAGDELRRWAQDVVGLRAPRRLPPSDSLET